MQVNNAACLQVDNVPAVRGAVITIGLLKWLSRSCSPAVTGDPKLGPLMNNGGPTFTQALLAGSPAIDAGDDSVVDPRGTYMTGAYVYTRCKDKFTLTGTGKVSVANGTVSLTDTRSDRKITAGFNQSQMTGRANITLIRAPGIYQTITLSQTNPNATCKCPS
jgi:hypothetical protein